MGLSLNKVVKGQPNFLKFFYPNTQNYTLQDIDIPLSSYKSTHHLYQATKSGAQKNMCWYNSKTEK